MRLLLLCTLLLAAPLFAKDDKAPLPDPNGSEGWTTARSLADVNGLSPETLHIRMYDATNEMLAALKRFEVLESLTLQGSYSDVGVRSLESLKTLRDLQIDCANLSNPSLTSIGKLTELEWLGLEQASQVSTAGIQALGGLKKLTWLIIHGQTFGDQGMPVANTGIADAALKSLGGMKEMERLDISGCTKLVGHGFKDCLPKMKELESLDLVSCDKLGDDALASLAKHPSLKTLMLAHLPEVSDKGISALDSLKALETLTIQECGISQACFGDLAKCKQLETLSIKGPSVVGADGLAKLAISKSLKTLSIEVWAFSSNPMGMPPGMDDDKGAGVSFDDSCLKLIGKFRALEQLHLTGINDITDAGLQHLKGLDLISVGLTCCGSITDTGVQTLSQIKGLRRILLSNISYGPPTGESGPRGPKVTDKGIEAIAKMESLTELDLSGQKQITNAGLKLLGGIKTLRTLRLSMVDYGMPGAAPTGKSPINDEGMAALSRLENITDLDVSGTDITDAGLVHLQALKTLESLAIHSCPKLTPAGIAALRAALGNCSLMTDEGRPKD